MGEVQYYDITVAASSSIGYARTSNPSDAAADIDLYLFDCSAGPQNCLLKRSSLTATSNEYVSWSSPAAGLWRVAVVTYSIPSGSAVFDYIDAVTNASFGSVLCADSSALRAVGATWSRGVTARANLTPDPGRFFQGFVYLVSSPGYVIGSAEVNMLF
jgi:hypothetical protein